MTKKSDDNIALIKLIFNKLVFAICEGRFGWPLRPLSKLCEKSPKPILGNSETS